MEIVPYEVLLDRMRSRIRQLSSCSHTMCSMAEAAGEPAEALALKQLMCAHRAWKQYDGKTNSWIPEFNTTDSRYCEDCGHPEYRFR